MGRLLVERGSLRGAIRFHEHKARRVVLLLNNIETSDAAFTQARPGIFKSRLLEEFHRFRFYMHMNMDDQHGSF